MTIPSLAPAPITSFRGPYRFLSNFGQTPFEFPLVYSLQDSWPDAEHPYQAAKAMGLQDQKWIADAPTAGEAKRRGSQVTRRSDWNQVKRQIMMQIVLAKFARPQTRGMLLATEYAALVEGNTWGDYFWGAVNPNLLLDQPQPVPQLPVHYGEGEVLVGWNWLGRILMMTRDLMS